METVHGHPAISPEAVRCVVDTPRLFPVVVRQVTEVSTIPPDRLQRMAIVRDALLELTQQMVIEDEAGRFAPEQVSSAALQAANMLTTMQIAEHCSSFVRTDRR